MVQREVKKKAQAYGLMAILLASTAVVLIYSFGASPGMGPINPSPTNPPFSTEGSAMKTFGSYDELKTFLTTNSPNSQTNSYYWVGTAGGKETLDSNAQAPAVPSPTAAPASTDSRDYSTTNIQVAGVDEADTVKTDGNYLYVVANNSVYILNADPQDARVLKKLTFENASVSGIYLSGDGGKLVVLGDNYIPYSYMYADVPTRGADIAIYPYYRSSTTFAYVYDISNKEAPVLTRNVTMSGGYFNSRMIGNYLYNIVTENAYIVNGTVFLPTVYNGAEGTEIPATNVYYSSANDTYGSSISYSYTTFLAIDLENDAQQPGNLTVMLSGSDNMYVSTDNIYITYPVYEWPVLYMPAPVPTTASANSSDRAPDENITVTPMVPISVWHPSTMKTTVYRIGISGDSMTFQAQGNVTGTVLNQYSMDESDGYFRVATNAYVYDSDDSYMGTQQNNVYVLDMNLNVVGKVENIASGEEFHSARFMGNRCYLVTFETVDPLFVIDLSQPTSPQVLGNLTIPGYSDYLHPYDETHLIGIGQDVDPTIDADLVHTRDAVYYTAVLGLKLSLFDVSNVNAPTEIANIVIGDRQTSSLVTNDPHALLFDRSKDLLVIPINLYEMKEATATSPSGPEDGKLAPSPTSTPSYPTMVWQGVYVFKVTLDGGFEVRGNVTQLSSEMLANLAQSTYYYFGGYDSGYSHWITRSLYIGNTLYTFSKSAVQLNSLDNFDVLATIELT